MGENLKKGDVLYYRHHNMVQQVKVLAVGIKYARCERGILINLKTFCNREDGYITTQYYKKPNLNHEEYNEN
jgi:hypothetical protein